MPVFNNFYPPTPGQIGPGSLRTFGPRFPVEIHIPNPLATLLTNQGRPIPQPATGFALFDTGASLTSVDDGIINALGVAPVGQGNVLTPSGQAQQSLYPARLFFPQMRLGLDLNSVFGAQLNMQGIIALIGRDILSRMVFTYNGPGGFVTIGF